MAQHAVHEALSGTARGIGLSRGLAEGAHLAARLALRPSHEEALILDGLAHTPLSPRSFHRVPVHPVGQHCQGEAQIDLLLRGVAKKSSAARMRRTRVQQGVIKL